MDCVGGGVDARGGRKRAQTDKPDISTRQTDTSMFQGSWLLGVVRGTVLYSIVSYYILLPQYVVQSSSIVVRS